MDLSDVGPAPGPNRRPECTVGVSRGPCAAQGDDRARPRGQLRPGTRSYRHPGAARATARFLVPQPTRPADPPRPDTAPLGPSRIARSVRLGFARGVRESIDRSASAGGVGMAEQGNGWRPRPLRAALLAGAAAL